MAAERNDFNINLGDTIYSDSEVAGVKPALTRQAKWAKYRQNLALAPLRTLRASAGTYSHWDDHEFVNDFSRAEHGNALYAAGAKAFTDYSPVRTGADGLYRTFRWGRHLELFFLDERSFRSAKASAGGTCNVAGAPDLAPTAPAAVRQAFTLLVPSLAQPVPQACIDRIADPSRTMLGTRQLTRFLRDVRRSTATFKVIVNETPLMQLFALPYDRWDGYAPERQRVVEALRGVKNVVVLTTDTHANLVGDVRLQTFTPNGPVPSGVTEVITGPVATNTYAKEVDEALGREGIGELIGAVFFKPEPPVGSRPPLRLPRHLQLCAGDGGRFAPHGAFEGSEREAGARRPRRALRPGRHPEEVGGHARRGRSATQSDVRPLCRPWTGANRGGGRGRCRIERRRRARRLDALA